MAEAEQAPPMSDFILHHYDTSPFSEKVRLMFGLKGLAWRSVIQPSIMPKPDLTPLTGGYRRAPVMQIGADVFCDTQVILAELEARAPGHASAASWPVNLWADRLFFAASVPIIFGAMGDAVPKAFVEDREKLSGRPFDLAAMRAAGGHARQQWRAQAGWLEAGLAAAPFLEGERPGLADVAAYMNVWFVESFTPDLGKELLAGFAALPAWRDRLRAVGHGSRQDMSTAEALDVAASAEPAGGVRHDDNDPLGLAPGDPVIVQADDYGRDPIEGRLVAANAERIVVAREDARLGRLHVHFPRAGYVARPGG